MYRYLVAAGLLMAAAGVAAAQQSSSDAAPALVAVEDGSKRVEVFNLSVGQLEDMEIRNRDGTQIGQVHAVLMTADGVIVAVSAEVGSFLGIGNRKVALRLDQLRPAGDALIADVSREQIEALPAWQD